MTETRATMLFGNASPIDVQEGVPIAREDDLRLITELAKVSQSEEAFWQHGDTIIGE